MTKVVVEPDESFERQHYEKPSARRKRKALTARKKARRRERTSD